MLKVFAYKMHAGQCGTDETYFHVGEEEADNESLWEIVVDHAQGYGVEEVGEDGEFEEDGQETGSPEIWLDATITTLEELEEWSGNLCGSTEAAATQLEKEGMVWSS
jgi:hypothetical protein